MDPGRYYNIRNLMVMKSTIKNAGTATDCKQHLRQARKTGSEIRDHGSAHNRTAVFCGRCFSFNDNQMVCDAVLAFEVAYPGDSAFLQQFCTCVQQLSMCGVPIRSGHACLVQLQAESAKTSAGAMHRQVPSMRETMRICNDNLIDAQTPTRTSATCNDCANNAALL
mgnify:CR=1 FL=1